MTLPEAVPVRFSRARAIGWSVAYFGLGFFLSVVFASVIVALIGYFTGSGARVVQGPGAWPAVIQGISGLLGFGLATWVIGIRTLRLSGTDLRWRVSAPRAGAFGLGLVVGIVPAVLALLGSLAVGHAMLTSDEGGVGAYVGRVLLTALVLAPAALVEEVAFRGVAQVTLAAAFGRWPTMVTLSALFGLAHILNPEVTALSLLNIALAGLFLAVAFYLPGGIWSAWGAHLGWNAALAAFDAPVSGLPFNMPMLDYHPGGPRWLTGGAFGPEGGVLATVAILLATVVIARRMMPEDGAHQVRVTT